MAYPLTTNAIPSGLGHALAPEGLYPKVGSAIPISSQTLNRYSYVLNNPLKYTDPTGNWPSWGKIWSGIKHATQATVNSVKHAAQSVYNKALEIKKLL